ncbi:MAG: 3-deoxy-D-manno-octulosonic acid transferase [Rhodobacteraceae bacterium]|nr:3-deoxy-D-manno-octulosonic acid transferase [Paracoccaceae bacterium]
MGQSAGFSLYLAVSARSRWLAHLVLRRRLRRGKEDIQRIEERLGRSRICRPEGQLVWFHSASVGEVMSILELVRRLGDTRSDLSFLMTTGTLASAQILQSRMPPRTIHQFVPYDVLPLVETFLDHWCPDVGIWTESEFWPALIYESHRREIPLLCINARMSARSFRRWCRLPAFAGSLLNRFEKTLVQGEETADKLRRLGLRESKMEVVGSLKRGAEDLPYDKAGLEEFQQLIAGRPLWLAASTHEGEVEAAAQAHLELMRRRDELLLILVPRHPERGHAVATRLRALGIQLSLRSQRTTPAPGDQIYIADTLGELGLWYRLAPVSFIGGSLVDAGGHNPLEPIRLGSAVIHGPFVANFEREFRELVELDVAVLAQSPDDLAVAVDDALQGENSARLSHAAAALSDGGGKVTAYVAGEILNYLPPLRPAS